MKLPALCHSVTEMLTDDDPYMPLKRVVTFKVCTDKATFTDTISITVPEGEFFRPGESYTIEISEY